MFKLKKHVLRDTIYGYSEFIGFGDIWAVTSYLLRLSQESGKPSKFSSRNDRIKSVMRDIIPFLDSKGSIKIVGEAPQKVLSYCEPFLVKFVPTIKRWEPNKSKVVAYQFDGRHLAKLKNLPERRFSFFLDSLGKLGFNPIDVGGYKPLDFIVDTLASCRFFIGCPSGLSVASISVGNPVYLITRQMNPLYVKFMFDCQYKLKPVKVFGTVDEFIMHAERLTDVPLL